MRNFWKTLQRCSTLLLVVMLCANKTNAQATLDAGNPPPSSCLPTDPDYDPRLCVPIDGGLAILLLAGVGYGIKKYRYDHTKVTEQPGTSD